jgi:hypothetical protein
MRKSPVKFKFNDTTITAQVNSLVPGKGFVNVLAQYGAELVDEGTTNPGIKIYVECNAKSTEPGRIYALFYNLRTKQFDGNFTVN